jgi:succinate dehydrogenase / fumarate reductase iron-sulfur subunit
LQGPAAFGADPACGDAPDRAGEVARRLWAIFAFGILAGLPPAQRSCGMHQIVYRVQRYDGQQRYAQEYAFPHEPNKTILWGLTTIKETIDPTLSFVAVCRVGGCGACAVRVNGQAVLACETLLDEAVERFGGTLHIAPISNFDVVRDLAVDWEPKVERLKQAKPWLIPQDRFTTETGCRQTPEEYRKILLQSRCILCGACASECGTLGADSTDFSEPFLYTKASKFIADSRDQDALERLQWALAHGLWNCVHCQECVTKCPKGLDPADDISRMRQESIRTGLTGNVGARHALAFDKDLCDTGRLNEVRMALRTEGWLRASRRALFALRLVRKGKLNPLHRPAPVQGIDDVRAIAKATRRAKGT